jgi:hypothetical protein
LLFNALQYVPLENGVHKAHWSAETDSVTKKYSENLIIFVVVTVCVIPLGGKRETRKQEIPNVKQALVIQQNPPRACLINQMVERSALPWKIKKGPSFVAGT